LKAINQDSPTVPTLLTDYILKGIDSSIYNEVWVTKMYFSW